MKNLQNTIITELYLKLKENYIEIISELGNIIMKSNGLNFELFYGTKMPKCFMEMPKCFMAFQPL